MALTRACTLSIIALLCSCASPEKKPEDGNAPILSMRGIEVDRPVYETSTCLQVIDAGTTQAAKSWGEIPPNQRQKKVMDLFAEDYSKLKGPDDGASVPEALAKPYNVEDKKLMQLLKLFAPKLANGCLNDLGLKIKKCMSKKKFKKADKRECVKASTREIAQKYLTRTGTELRALK